MGAVSDLIYDIRSDIKAHCPPETLTMYDHSMGEVLKWEDEDYSACSISPTDKKFWAKPHLVLAAFTWLLAGVSLTIVAAVLAVATNTI